MEKKKSKGTGDWTKIKQDEFTVRAKEAILRKDPPETYKVKK